jgi:hypothetical protein
MLSHMLTLEFGALSGFVVQGNRRTFLGGNAVEQDLISSGQLCSQQ